MKYIPFILIAIGYLSCKKEPEPNYVCAYEVKSYTCQNGRYTWKYHTKQVVHLSDEEAKAKETPFTYLYKVIRHLGFDGTVEYDCYDSVRYKCWRIDNAPPALNQLD